MRMRFRKGAQSILSIILSAVMVVGLSPMTALAESSDSSSATQIATQSTGVVPTVTTTALAAAGVGAEYSAQLAATGDPSEFTWQLVDGSSLPAGLSLASSGVISGTPTIGGDYTFSVTAANTAGTSAAAKISISVTDAPVITTTALANATTGSAYSATLAATGSPASMTWGWVAAEGSSLPDGLALDASTGAITGTPTASGVYTVVVSASNGIGTAATKTLTLTVKDKYKKLTGTVYVNVSLGNDSESHFITSDGEISGTQMWRVPVDLAEVSKIDLDNVTVADGINLSDTKYDADNDGVYEVTMLQLFVYISQKYSAAGVSGFSVSVYGGQVWIGSFMGTGSNSGAMSLYSVDDYYPIDEALTKISGYSMGAALNHIPLADGSTYNYLATTSDNFFNNTNSDFTMFATGKDYTTKTGGVTYAYDATSGKPLTITLKLSTLLGRDSSFDPNGYATYCYPESGASLYYGTAYNPDGGTAVGTTDANGQAQITFDKAGTYYLWAKGDGNYTSAIAVVTVKDTPVITTDALDPATVNTAYTGKLVANNNDCTWYLAAGNTLPDGLTLAADGTVSGTPTKTGAYKFSVMAMDPYGSSSLKEISLDVNEAPVIATDALAAASLGTAYTATIAATGYPTPTVSVTGLPAGLTFDVATGAISGTPTAAGTASVTITATNAADTATKTLDLAVDEVPAITTTALDDATAGTAYTAAIAATGYPVPTVSVTGLPAGLTFDAATGTISGTPAAGTGGSYKLTVTAANGTTDATQALTLNVNETPAITTDANLPLGYIGTDDDSYSAELVATGYPAVNWVMQAGDSLPDGLTLAADGTISGTPTKAGTYTFHIAAVNAQGASSVKEFTLIVLGFSIPNYLESGIVGELYTCDLSTMVTGCDPSLITWSKGYGPSKITISDAGLLSATYNYSSSGSTFSVKAAVKGFEGNAVVWSHLRIRTRYDNQDGTIYVSVTKDGKYLTSDGETTGTLMADVPLDMAKVGATNLADYGLADYNYAIPSSVGRSEYHENYATDLQLYLYVLDNYYSGKAASGFSLGSYSKPGSLWINGFWGLTSPYLTYAVNGQTPLDASNNMLTADRIVMKDGDHVTINLYSAIDFWGDANACDHYFVDGSKVITQSYAAYTGEESTVNLESVKYGMNSDYSTNVTTEPTANYTVSYGTTYGTAVGTATTDTNGAAKITFPTAGTWYVWADGGNGATHASEVVSSPAIATVTVTDKAAAAITTTTLDMAHLNKSYSMKLTASGNPAAFTWTLTSGALPDGLTLATDGTISGTPTVKGDSTFTVSCTNGVGEAATATYTLSVGDKYKQVTGTVYLSISYNGKFVAANTPGNENVAIGYLPVDLSKASQFDLDAAGYGSFNTDANHDGYYDCTWPQIFLYVESLYYTGANGFNVYPSGWVNNVWGLPKTRGNVIYEVHGKSTGMWTQMTAADGDYFDMLLFDDWLVWGSQYFGCHYFIQQPVTAWSDAKIVHEYSGVAGNPVTVTLAKENMPKADDGSYLAASNYALHYGTAYDLSTDNSASTTMGTVTTGADGSAQIVFDKAGTYYVWADGAKIPEATNGHPVNTAAVAKVTVAGKPEVTTEKLDSATAGNAYTAQLEATGGDCSWYLAAGSSLPDGLTLAADGTVSGTPTKAGSYKFSVMVSNSYGASSLKEIALDVCTVPEITTAEFAHAVAGTAYTAAVAATGDPAPTVSVTGLPDGLTFDAATGAISGTPTAAGTASVTITAANAAGTATKTLDLAVDEVPAITTTALDDATAGTAYTATIAATGTPAPTLSIEGALPAGLTFDAATGTISGTPAAGTGGSYKLTVKAANGTTDATQALTLNVNEKPVITTDANLPKALSGNAYLTKLEATGYPAPSWVIAAGSSLPEGLTLAADGTISGTPSKAGTYSFKAAADNAQGMSEVREFTLKVSSGTAPIITTTELPGGPAGTAYSQKIAASGEPAPTLSVVAGSLPTGLELAADGTISGTPTKPGLYTFTVKADNGIGTAATREFTMRIQYSDVTAGDWSEDWVNYVSDHGLMSGYSGTTLFGPMDNITRGQVATILYRYACSKDSTLVETYGSTTDPAKYSNKAEFNDEATGTYYTAAVNWAKAAKIMTGDASTGYTTVRPDASISREELCVMIQRYAATVDPEKAAKEGSVNYDNIQGMDKVDSWAISQVKWCASQGIIGGVSTASGKSMNPTDPTWRASMAKMITVTLRDVLG